MFKYLLLLFITCSLYQSFASPLYKVQLSYMDTIDNDDYVGEIELLRDDVWLKDNNIDDEDDTLNISLLEFGIVNVNAKVNSIDLYQTSNVADKTSSKVTGLFKRYAKEVFTYKSKDIATNKIISLNATPNHRFYVINRDEYEEISAITQNDLLLSQTGEKVKLMCDVSVNVDGCGTQYNKDGKPTLVYNMEVDGTHRYYVGGERGILVHNNGCGVPELVARFDNRSPNSIFHNMEKVDGEDFILGPGPGFQPRGTANTDITKHLDGAENSAFISTTSHQIGSELDDFIRKFATNNGYVYMIDTSSGNFKKTNNMDYAWEAEIISLGAIPSNKIVGAIPVLKNDKGVFELMRYRGSGYKINGCTCEQDIFTKGYYSYIHNPHFINN